MNTYVMQILSGALGVFGYALCVHVRKKHLASAMLGGALAWIVYLVLDHFSAGLFVSTLAASMVVYIWSEIMARIMKAPVTIFLLPGILPLLPGSFLFYTMSALLDHRTADFKLYGIETVVCTMGIACGVVIASIIFYYLINSVQHFKEKRMK